MGHAPTALVVILGANFYSSSLANFEPARPDCPAAPPPQPQPRFKGTATSEHLLLQFAGHLSRLPYVTAYDGWDSEVLPKRRSAAESFSTGPAATLELAAKEDAVHFEEQLRSDELDLDEKVAQLFPEALPSSAQHPRPFPILSSDEWDQRGIPLQPSRSPKSIVFQQQNPQCGFVGGSFEKETVCAKIARHNCKNVSVVAAACPASCTYVLPDPLFSCGAACVAKDDCGKLGGRSMGFADPVTRRCGTGPIQGCIRHFSHNVCSKCGRMFSRSLNGEECTFLPGYQRFAIILLFIIVVLLAILLPLNFKHWCRMPIGSPAALAYGWKQRSRTLASVTKYEDPTRMPEKYPLNTNMHSELVAGAGLCLFYNSLVFLLAVSVLVAAVVTIIWWMTALPKLGSGGKCTLDDEAKFDNAVQDLAHFQEVSAVCYGFLWVVLFAASLGWARLQHLAFRKLDADTSLMSDFAFRVSGLPHDASEAEIATFFGRLAPSGIVGVSIAYDYREHKDLIARLLDNHVQTAEQHTVALKHLPGPQESPEESKATSDHRLAHAVLSRLNGSGTAFVVCKSELQRQMLYDRFADGNPMFRGKNQVALHLVHEEPTCFFWENFAYGRQQHLFRGSLQLVVLSLEMLALGLIVYWPAAYYILYRLMATRDDSTDPVVAILGYGIAIMNCIMYMLVDISSRRVGFYYKVDVDKCNLVGCSIIVGVQTFFNLAVAYFAVRSVDVSMSPSLFSSQGKDEFLVRQSSAHVFIAAKLWNLLVPGVLVLPDLVGRLLKYVLSATAMYDYWVYIPYIKRDLRTDQTVTPYEAEYQLLPAPMQTEFDYSNSICITSTVFLMFFFHSEYAHPTCWILVLWVLVSYVSLKYCHLRFNRVVEYTSHQLDDCFTYLWGIPLSIVAAASAYWTANFYHLPWWWTLVAFSASLLAYLIFVHLVFKSVSPSDNHGKGNYAEARKHLRYDYFNTNPVKVLRSHFLQEGQPLTYFVRGKEYLQKPESDIEVVKDYLSDSGGCAPRGCSRLWSYEEDADSDYEPSGCLKFSQLRRC